MERRRKVPWGVGQRKCLPLTFTGKRTGRDVKAANHPLTTNETPHPVRSVIAAVARLFPRLFHVEWRSTTEPVLVLPNVRRLTTALRVVFGHYVVFEASDFGNSDSQFLFDDSGVAMRLLLWLLLPILLWMVMVCSKPSVHSGSSVKRVHRPYSWHLLGVSRARQPALLYLCPYLPP